MLNKIWKIAGIPIIFLIAFSTFFFLWRLLDLPSDEELLRIVESSFDKYGYFIMPVSALIEGFIFAGFYYPGSFVIFLGVILSDSISQLFVLLILVTLGLSLAHIINFALGRYGWHKLLVAVGFRTPIENAKRRLTKYGLRAIFLSYWMPNLASLTATAAGIMHYPFKKFLLYSLIATITWNTVWAAVVYTLGEAALKIVGIQFVLVIIFGWILLNLISSRKKKKQEQE